VALRDAKDPYVTAAVLSSVKKANVAAVVTGITKDPKRKPSPDMISKLVQTAAALGDEGALQTAIDFIANSAGEPGKQFTALAGALDGVERSGKSLGSMTDKLAGIFDAAREAAIDDAAAPELRSAAVALLARGKPEDREGDVDLLGALLTPQTPEKVQFAAIGGLSRVATPAAAKALLGAWKEMTPGLRATTLDALLRQQAFVGPLLDALEAKTVRASDLDPARRRQLLEHADEAVRKRAEKALAGAVNPDRQKVIDQFGAALTLKGDPAKGREFFNAVCATCHKVGNVGVNVGPDLMSVAEQSPEYYLLHILDPSRAVEAKYTQYVAETKSGQTLSGVLAGETGNSVTLMAAGGQPQTVLRADLKRLRATPLSAMPDGVEVGRTPQDFADLIAFLLSSRAEKKL
jgi:putative heme-binding domain-containing protein